MRPHEETWSAVGDVLCFSSRKWWPQAPMPEPGIYGISPARAKLAAQAPAMARELLGLLTQDESMHRSAWMLTRQRLEDILRDAGVIP